MLLGVQSGVDDSYLQVDGQSRDWLQLWRTMLHLFRASPHDCFTWGLRLAPTTTTEESYLLWQSLDALLTHPFWDGRLYVLRYFLQKAIYLRVPNHMEPLCPLSRDGIGFLTEHYSSLSRVGFDPDSCGTIVSTSTFSLWKMGRPEKGKAGSLLSQEMVRMVEEEENPTLATSELEETLFFLTCRDVCLIQRALDSLGANLLEAATTDWPFQHPVSRYAKAYSRATTSTELLPSQRAQMREWDHRCITTKRRERIADIPDIPKSERLPGRIEWYWRHPDCDSRFRESVQPTREHSQEQNNNGDGDDDDDGKISEAGALNFNGFIPDSVGVQRDDQSVGPPILGS